ncbi:MAG: VUT family protein [Bacilli bacterium]|nr:VUT family protein [Bacilli bacterium]
MDSIFFLCILIISLLVIYICNNYLKKEGLIVLFITSSAIAYILSFKYLSFQNISYNANSIIYVTMLTAIYLLLENNTKKEINKIVNLNFTLTIFAGIIVYIMSIYIQSLSDTIGINMINVFKNNYRILLAYPLSLFISQKILIKIYEKIKNLYDNLFISTVTTYLAIDLIELIIFISLSYYNIHSISDLIKLMLSTYMIRLIITLIYSLFLTIISKKKVKS